MCLAVPGSIISINEKEGCGQTGIVDFNGSQVEVYLSLTPEVRPGDWVLVHAGFAISEIDEEEARKTWSYLEQAGLVADDSPEPLQRDADEKSCI